MRCERSWVGVKWEWTDGANCPLERKENQFLLHFLKPFPLPPLQHHLTDWRTGFSCCKSVENQSPDVWNIISCSHSPNLSCSSMFHKCALAWKTVATIGTKNGLDPNLCRRIYLWLRDKLSSADFAHVTPLVAECKSHTQLLGILIGCKRGWRSLKRTCWLVGTKQ